MPSREPPADRPRRGATHPAANASEDDDRRLWRAATRDVQPLRPPPPPADASPATLAAATPPIAAAATGARRPTSAPGRTPADGVRPRMPELAPGVAHGLDQRMLIRLKRGQIAPETQIDLHRMTQATAHEALIRFLAAAQRAERRCVLIITGKGSRSEGAVGVLKANVPRWLNEPPNRERVLAFSHATLPHGGDGALYVLLRRYRKPDR
jgi:DNA-nicking Smr family endonuclease